MKELLQQIIARAIETALQFVGRTEESGNRAPWLDQLFSAYNPALWQPGDPYALPALLTIYESAAATHGMRLTWEPSMDADSFAADNAAPGIDAPAPGDIMLFRVGGSPRHAALVLEPFLNGVRTVEFNTSPTYNGVQHAGEGVFRKYRDFAKITDVVFIRPALAAPEAQNAATRTERGSSDYMGDGESALNIPKWDPTSGAIEPGDD